jgi:membrane protein DedA with SNARE-associated domain
METIVHWVTHYGYAGIFALLMLGIVGIPVPDEGLLTFAGYLVYKGELHLVPTIAAAFLGSACGITVSYGLGRTAGLYLITEYGRFLHLTAERVDRVHRWFDRVGKWGLLFGYFLPGVRHLTALLAGTAKLRMPVFALFAYTGGFLWSVTFVSVGYFLGEEWARVSEQIHRHLLIGAGVVVTAVVLFVLFQYRRRKQHSAPG